MDESIKYAQKFLSDVLSFFGLNTDIATSYEEDVIELKVPSSHLNGFLIGSNGDTLRALQSIISSALRAQGKEFYRVNLDVADYKLQKNEKLAEKARGWIQEVVDSKTDKDLYPMNAADRRVIHKEVSNLTEVDSESVGEGRDRYIRLLYKA